jgi:hypothetical protein
MQAQTGPTLQFSLGNNTNLWQGNFDWLCYLHGASLIFAARSGSLDYEEICNGSQVGHATFLPEK